MFVDFGWDTGDLYPPEELLSKTDYEDYLYGDTGKVTDSHGEFETLFSNVINYDAKVRDDGGFDCSVEIVSKNTAILTTDIDTTDIDRIKKTLDTEVVSAAVSVGASPKLPQLSPPALSPLTTAGEDSAGVLRSLSKLPQLASPLVSSFVSSCVALDVLCDMSN